MAATPEELGRLIEGAGLGRIVDDLVRHAKPSIRIHTRLADEAMMPVGASRVGGMPDLPPDVAWPLWNGKPLSFVCQINVQDAAEYNSEHTLPSVGLLSFFYGADEQPWGFDPKDSGGWRVFFFPPEAGTLAPAAVPSEVIQMGQFSHCAVEFASEWTIPDTASGVGKLLNLSHTQFETMFDLADRLYTPVSGPMPHIHRLLGHPQHVQGEMQMECQLAYNGVYCGNADSPQSEEAKALAVGASDWRLLLQIDSDDDAGMMWGDSGRNLLLVSSAGPCRTEFRVGLALPAMLLTDVTQSAIKVSD